MSGVRSTAFRGWICAVLLACCVWAAPPIVVGSDRNFPPYEYVDAQGHPMGFNIDLIREVAAEEGLSIEIRPGVWSDLRQGFQRGDIQVLSGMFLAQERLDRIQFSVPHSVPSYAIFRRKGGPVFRSEADLIGKRLLAQRGDIVFEHLNARHLQVEGVPSPEEALRKLAAGEADWAVVLKPVGLFFVKRNGLRNVEPTGGTLFPQKYCFAVKKGDAELLSRLNEGLFILKETGKFAEISARHFAPLEAMDLPFRVLLRRTLIVLVPLLGAFLAVLGWSWSLRRRVHQRTLSLHEELMERQRAEASLRQSEERYRLLTENNHDLVCEVDLEGRIDYVNPNYTEILGLPPERLLGKRPSELEDIAPEDRVTFLALHDQLARQGSTATFDYRLRDRKGEWHWFEGRAKRFANGAGEARIVAISRDVTERRRSEEILRQTQKLEGLGLLAGGIAHDFNNLLTAILGNVNLAQNVLAAESPAQAFLENVENAVLKASDLTKQMLAYSGKGRFVVKLHDLNSVVREMTHLLRVSIPKKIGLRFDLTSALPPIEADAAQIQQVVMNLVTNASDAIADGEGTITISTRLQELDEAYVASAFADQGLEAGPYAVLEVEDTGCGMSPEVLARIFDPFFTTKVMGRGLGLSAMLGILRGHRAGIKISSEAGHGTCFRLFFRASSREAALPAPEDALLPEGFKGTALVVDDEPAIRESLSYALKMLGFMVETAVDGQDAVEKFQALGGGVDLVILDLTMPRMDGREAFGALRALRPGLPVILSSGYSEQASIQELVDQNRAGFLQKPYQIKALQRAIQAAMDNGEK